MTDAKQPPVLWMVENSRGISQGLFFSENDAQNEADRLNIERLRSDYVAVPLFRHPPPPTLTDAEREAVAIAQRFYSHECETYDATVEDVMVANTLCALLARLGGAS